MATVFAQAHVGHPAPAARPGESNKQSRRAQRLAAIKVPPVIIHARASGGGTTTTRTYEKIAELGKGGFARCYQFHCVEKATDLAGKVVAKASLAKERARLKLLTEIRVHRAVHHRHVVRFDSFFEDENNVYMMMELCSNGSLVEMVRARGALGEVEARGFMLQLVDACRYLHHHGIIHRDLKLGNIFLAADMTVRVGDFGLATKLLSREERKLTVCGTPNYIAPEVLDSGEEGHSFEVDVWSLGVILFTMLVGRPPFETRDVKHTYSLIRKGAFSFPASVHVSGEAKDLVGRMLQTEPSRRPSLDDALSHPFFCGPHAYVPAALHPSALTVAPYFSPDSLVCGADAARAAASFKPFEDAEFQRGPQPRHHEDEEEEDDDEPMEDAQAPLHESQARIIEGDEDVSDEQVEDCGSGGPEPAQPLATASAVRSSASASTPVARSPPAPMGDAAQQPGTLARVVDTLRRSLEAPSQLGASPAAAAVGAGVVSSSSSASSCSAAPEAGPRVWVVKWVDYTSKYGLGFLLSDGSVGVHFMDVSKIVCASDGVHLEYCPAMPQELRPRDPVTGRKFVPVEAHTVTCYPESLKKKVALLLHFRKYLLEHWQKAIADGSALPQEVASIRAGGPTSGLVFLKKWLRTEHAAVFRLSDRTVQACFFDGSSVAVSPDCEAAMFTDKHSVRSHHLLATIATNGSQSVLKRLRYVKDLLAKLVHTHLPTSSSSSAPHV